MLKKIICKFNRGFTIIEIIVSVTIVGILVGIVAVNYSGWQTNVANVELKNDLNSASVAMENYRTFNNAYPVSVPSTFTSSPQVTISGGSDDGGLTFCLDATSLRSPSIHFHSDSSHGVQSGSCGMSAPKNLVATVLSTSTINLTWGVVANAISYELQRDSNSAFTGAITIATPTSNSASSSGLTQATTYYYRVNVTLPAGTSDWSTPASATTAITTPSAPVIATPATSDSTTTTWSWNTVSCATGTAKYRYDYLIDAVSQAPAGWKTPSNELATSISPTTSIAGHTYTVKTQARCYTAATTSAWSATSNAVDYVRVALPSAPTLTATTASSTSINLSWTAVSGATNYILERATTSGFAPSTQIASQTSTTFTTSSLSQGTPYYFRVNVTTATGTSGWSTSANATTTITVPSAPVIATPAISDSTTTTWTWGAVSCAAGTTARYQYDYLIDTVSQAPSGWKTPSNPLSTSTAAFTTVSTGHTYTVKTQAQCYTATTTSAWSVTSNAVDYYRPLPTYTLAISAGTNGTVNTAVNGTYNSGSTPTITATPNANYNFSSWTGGGNCALPTNTASHTIAMTADQTCVANFTLKPYVLVGSVGAVSVGAAAASVTPAWGTSSNRTAGNLLVCFVSFNAVATFPAVPTGWTLAISRAGTSTAAAIYYKVATGADTAPTLAGATSRVISARLAEFSGGTKVVDKTGVASGTTSPSTATASGVDVNASGQLIVTATSIYYSMAATKTLTNAINNAVEVDTTNAGTSTLSHYAFAYGISTTNSVAASNPFVFTTTKITGVANVIVTFK